MIFMKRRAQRGHDPDLTNLTINKYNYLPHDGDWERDGNAIGGNVHINELCFAFNLGTVVARDKFKSFCRGLANNKSIERLGIYCCCFGGEIFTMLVPFFQQNSNLRCFVIDSGSVAGNCASMLSDSLTRFNTLREFDPALKNPRHPRAGAKMSANRHHAHK